jgi:hypothetical protein
MAPHKHQIGDIVFWGTASTAGEYTVIGYPKGEPDVLVFEEGGRSMLRTAGRLIVANRPGNIGFAISRNSPAS